MERDKQQLESLHQQASALYLQGEYSGALQAWSQLLGIDPQDERAREGVRLCELLVEEQGGAVPQKPAPAAPAAGEPPQAPAVGMGIGEELDQELDELDEMLSGGKSEDWMDNPAPAAEQPAESAGSAEALDFDLSEVPSQPAPEIPAAAAAPPAAPPGGIEFNFEGTDQQATVDAVDSAFDFTAPQPEPAAVAPPAADVPAANVERSATDTGTMAAEELQNRTNELMAEALECYEQGKREAALGALSRLQILDESNEAGRTFAEHIQAEIEAQKAPAAEPAEAVSHTHPSLPTVDAAQNHDPMDLGSEAPAGLGVEDAVEAPPPAGAEFVEGAEAEVFDPLAGDPLLEDDLMDAAVPAPPAKAAVKTSGTLPTRWLLIAAVGLVVVGGAFLALQLFGGGGSPDAEGSVRLGGPPPLLPEGAGTPPSEGPDQTGEAAVDAGGAETPAVAVDPAAIDEVMDRGDRDFESGEFAAAVLAYNEALKLDPQNEVAKRRLQEAGDLFREQKESLEQRASAIQAFNDGDYRNALRLFYRLQPANDVEQARFTRYRMNGWFNMGIRALKSGDCRLARSHLKEAQSVDPLDRGLRGAMDLTVACFEGHTQSYFDSVRGLRFRGLED